MASSSLIENHFLTFIRILFFGSTCRKVVFPELETEFEERHDPTEINALFWELEYTPGELNASILYLECKCGHEPNFSSDDDVHPNIMNSSFPTQNLKLIFEGGGSFLAYEAP